MEGATGYSRKAYDETEGEIHAVAQSVDAGATVEELREKLAQQEGLVSKRKRLHGEAWDQAIAEDAARNQEIADTQKREELLSRLHENAGIKEATAHAGQANAEHADLGHESAQADEKELQAEELYKSLDLSRGRKEVFGSRKFVENNSGSLLDRIKFGLGQEAWNHEEKRKKFFGASMGVGALGVVGGLAGAAAAGSAGATFLGLTGSTLLLGGILGIGGSAVAVGALGWAGMKAGHALKEWRHEKAFNKLKFG